MKKKQVIGVLVVCLILIITGLIGVRSAVFVNEKKKDSSEKAMDTLEDILNTSGKDIDLPTEDFIGQIDIVGTIQPESTSSYSAVSSDEYKHNYYLQYIDKMEDADNNKGILLYVNSPGGTVYESDEMYLKLKEYKEVTGRPVYAYFADEACSGAYYISMAADKIYANRNTWTGSIGVIISLMNYEKLMEKIGVYEVDIASGKNKTLGSGAHQMTKQQEAILQSLVDESFNQFVKIVADGRSMSETKVRKLADGRIYSARQAKKYDLIDEIMGKEEAKSDICSALGYDEIQFYAPKKTSFLQDYIAQFSSTIGQITGKSDIQAARELIENDESGVLMYYAK